MTVQTRTPAISSPEGGSARNRLLQWVGVLGSPTAWGLQILSGYGLSGYSCHVDSVAPLAILGIVCGIIAIGSGLVALRQWQLVMPHGWRDLDDPEDRAAFMGILGVALSLLFVLLILMTGIANVVLNPCPILTMRIP
jgi:hypothetical protein